MVKIMAKIMVKIMVKHKYKCDHICTSRFMMILLLMAESKECKVGYNF